MSRLQSNQCDLTYNRQIKTDKNQPITADQLYMNLTANTIMPKLINHFQQTRLTMQLTDKDYSLDSEDDFYSGGRNVIHQQQFFSELPSLRDHNI